MGRRTPLTLSAYTFMVKYINEHEIFWLADLKGDIGIESNDETHPLISPVRWGLSQLKKKMKVQCCKVEGGRRQYIRIEKITLEDFYEK